MRALGALRSQLLAESALREDGFYREAKKPTPLFGVLIIGFWVAAGFVSVVAWRLWSGV
jgi:hypothetical protein